MEFNPTYKPFGRQAILIEWKPVVDEIILNDILHFKEKITLKKKDFFKDLIVGYNSLTILYKEGTIDFVQEIKELKMLYNLEDLLLKKTNFVWEIPVCYHTNFGIDLLDTSKKISLSVEEIISRHSEKLYTVFFIGFLPGFLYLGGLDSKLFMDRKSNPRLRVAKGSVAIGGMQTGIYPSESAGGWNIIGLSPVNFFDLKKEQPCFACAGDKIKFKPISLEEYYWIAKEVIEHRYSIIKNSLND